MKNYLLLICFSFLVMSCSDDFSPNGEYSPKLIVYSILDASKDTQYVRVYSSFDPKLYNPNSSSPTSNITGAVVKISDDSSEYVFRDTVVAVTSSSGTVESLQVYVAPKFVVKERKQYSLNVQAGTFPTATASSVSLELGQIFLFSTSLLFQPAAGQMITFDLYLGRNISAYMFTFVIEYEVFKNNVWVTQFREVPISIVSDGNGKVTKRFYPIPTLYAVGSSVYRNVKVFYGTENYTSVFNDINEEYVNQTYRFKSAHAILTQYDNDLFTYYSIANNFPGATTIRLDEPDYTNIANGYGVFGSMTKQTKTYGIPSKFP